MNPAMLHGDFVYLRPLTTDDAGLTFSWRQSSRAKFLNDSAKTIEQQRVWISSRPIDEYNFIIMRKDGLSLGMISLINIDSSNSRAEPGRFLIGNTGGARGIPAAAEAMLLLYQFAFKELQLHRLWGIIACKNTKMVKWQIYMGMVEEGRLTDHLRLAGIYYDAIVFGLTRDRFQELAEAKLESLIRSCSNHN
jgi:RimJ/RimL family protein N-acetyltransferase